MKRGDQMKVCWFSAGVSSFIASYLERETIDKIIYCHIDNQHHDSIRFLKNCESVLGKEIEILQSRYGSVDNVIETFNFINSRYGAKCTEILKKRVRKEWEYGKKDLIYVWGYDVNEKDRAEKTVEIMPDQKHIFPLIKNGFTKEDCHGLSKKLGVKRPAMYDLGYRNNNCIGCVKGGMGYWNKIRVDFPEVFERRMQQEILIGHSCLTEKINYKSTKLFLKDLDPNRGRFEDEVMEECSFVCQNNI